MEMDQNDTKEYESYSFADGELNFNQMSMNFFSGGYNQRSLIYFTQNYYMKFFYQICIYCQRIMLPSPVELS